MFDQRVDAGASDIVTNEDSEWFAAGYTARDAESFSGYHEGFVLIILDEAPGVPSYIWEAIEGLMHWRIGESIRERP